MDAIGNECRKNDEQNPVSGLSPHGSFAVNDYF
jgi:hypothetical protein